MKTNTRQYLDIEPWAITETGFHPDRSRVSESLFALANEFMGVRGHFDEGYSGDTLVGSYFNGVFDEQPIPHPLALRGFATRTHFMANAVDWFHTRLTIAGQTLDLNAVRFSDFVRKLDFRTGTMTRSFVWHTPKGKVRVGFTRFLGMPCAQLGFQRISVEPVDFTGTVKLTLGMDVSPIHEDQGKALFDCARRGKSGERYAMLSQAGNSRQKLLSVFRYSASLAPTRTKDLLDDEPTGKLAGVALSFRVSPKRPLTVDRITAHQVEKSADVSPAKFWKEAMPRATKLLKVDFDQELAANAEHWRGFWDHFDMTIEGDPANEQGTRYCMFQLHSTYRGVDPTLNIGAKGLTGETYGGLAFWDTESYCLAYYIFTDPDAARNLLMFRYNTLPQARQRAKELACEGARYPMTTIDGTEACGVWWHGDLEIHVPGAVAYGIWHYTHVTGDTDFLYRYGAEMLLEISRFYASHGGWSPKTGEFGLWGVMGADEFHMMCHNNAYTNNLARRTFEWALDAAGQMKRRAPDAWKKLQRKTKVTDDELARWRRMAKKMRTQRDPDTGLIEQQDGFFDLPDIDIDAIPPEQQPVVRKWPYIARSKYNWIKQPDVLLLHFFFSHSYTLQDKRVNYEYYEPKCIHESSLSPAVHSILASELGKHDKAFDYVQYASRLDLDDYNGNTDQGLHMTSMAGAWLALVYGFGGMRSDGPRLSFDPSLPARWKAFRFTIVHRDTTLKVSVDDQHVNLVAADGPAIRVDLFGKTVNVNAAGVRVKLPAQRRPRPRK